MKMEKSVLRQLTLWEIIMDVIIPDVNGYEVRNSEDAIIAEFGPREYKKAQQFIEGTQYIMYHLFAEPDTE